MSVLKGTERWKARHTGAEERNVLIRVGKEELHRQLIRRAHVDVEVCIELVFVIVSRHHCGVVDTAPRSLRARDYKCSIGVLRVQQVECEDRRWNICNPEPSDFGERCQLYRGGAGTL